MYNTIGIGGGTTATGLTGVTLLPNTGSFRVMFVISVIALSLGVAILAVAGFASVKKRFSTNKK